MEENEILPPTVKQTAHWDNIDGKLIIESSQDTAPILESNRFERNEFDVKPYIEKFDIDIIVHGDDWGHESYMEQIKVTETYLEEQSVKIEYLPYYDGVSTSGLISEIKSE